MTTGGRSVRGSTPSENGDAGTGNTVVRPHSTRGSSGDSLVLLNEPIENVAPHDEHLVRRLVA